MKKYPSLAGRKRGYKERDPETVSRNMAAIKAVGGATEVLVRSLLHRRGLRFRKNQNQLPGRPDIVFPTQKVAVFIDGDYWHARVLRERGPEALESSLQTKNRSYWLTKFTRRIALDDAATTALLASGWLVLRYWESEARRDPVSVADTIAVEVRNRTIKR